MCGRFTLTAPDLEGLADHVRREGVQIDGDVGELGHLPTEGAGPGNHNSRGALRVLT